MRAGSLASRLGALALLLAALAVVALAASVVSTALAPPDLAEKAALIARFEAALEDAERRPPAASPLLPVAAETAAVAGARIEDRLRRAFDADDAVLSSIRMDAAGDGDRPAVRVTTELTASHRTLQRALYTLEAGPIATTVERLTIEPVTGEADRLSVRLTLLTPWQAVDVSVGP